MKPINAKTTFCVTLMPIAFLNTSMLTVISEPVVCANLFFTLSNKLFISFINNVENLVFSITYLCLLGFSAFLPNIPLSTINLLPFKYALAINSLVFLS